jgi:serine phosphatase RsbU (regulator of sigma subunit)
VSTPAIVHRDLKPGNVMLTRSGAKLLDFARPAPTMSSRFQDVLVRRGVGLLFTLCLIAALGVQGEAQSGPGRAAAGRPAQTAQVPSAKEAPRDATVREQRDRELLKDSAFATLFASIGLLSFAAGLRWRAGRFPAFLLAAAMLLHSSSVLTRSEPVRAALGTAPVAWSWTRAITDYVIAVPWALLLEHVVGRGWKSSIRRAWQGFAIYAVLAILADVVTGQPGSVRTTQPPVIMTGAFVGFANLAFGGARPTPELGILRAGYLVFMAVVLHDNLAGLGLLPWRTGTPDQFGVLVFVACLVHTVVSGTLRGQRQLQAIELEMATARRIQASLLPSSTPKLDGAAVAFRHVPAAAVAGDLFQFLQAGPRHAGILVADVCGHGVPAALIASMVKVAAAAQRPHADQPARVLAGIHATIAGELPAGQFVTAVYVYLDLEHGMLRHASAGHPPALVRSASMPRVDVAGPTGPLLIALAPPDYPVTEISLGAGDRVVLYTDGVIEAQRGDAEMFGIERFRQLLQECGDDPEAFASSVIEAVARFTGRPTGPFEDDLTLVALQVTPRGAPERAAGLAVPPA